MKPTIILPPDVMSEEGIQQLRDNGFCVVVATEPAKVRMFDPFLARPKIEAAAIVFSRKILNGQVKSGDLDNGAGQWVSQSRIDRAFILSLVKGTALDPAEAEYDSLFDAAKAEEYRELGREEARAERAAKKAAKTAK